MKAIANAVDLPAGFQAGENSSADISILAGGGAAAGAERNTFNRAYFLCHETISIDKFKISRSIITALRDGW